MYTTYIRKEEEPGNTFHECDIRWNHLPCLAQLLHYNQLCISKHAEALKLGHLSEACSALSRSCSCLNLFKLGMIAIEFMDLPCISSHSKGSETSQVANPQPTV